MAIKFATNVPQTLCFPYGDFMEVNGQYGQQYLYTVEVDGDRDRLYATPTLHQELQSRGIAAGDVLTITKVEGEGNRKNWIVEATKGNGHPSEDSSHKGNGLPSEALAKGGRPDPPSFETIQHLASNCLQASMAIWSSVGGDVQFSSTDIRKFGISLFMECCRKGILPHPEPADADIPF